MRILILFVLVLVLASCGRDKGNYEIEGTFLDACTLKPLPRTKGVIYVYDRDSIQVNELGYFNEKNSWDEQLGWMLKPREFVDLETHLYDRNSFRSFYHSFSMPKGYTNMGNILLNTELAIPFRFVQDSSTCQTCKWEIRIDQMNSWQIRNYQKKINLSKVPEFIIDYASDKALEWNTITDMPQNPIVVTVIEIDSARVRSVKQSIDISDQIKRCGLSDTVEIPI